ncbi:MAG: NAD-dependent epimerase/dehydratase family protein [Eggerthellaceae bacterium]|nr:NAD-dependent epimerase/dehydratase family protein [Eggerthellaceae bacterium]
MERTIEGKNILLVGGAGFIGSHLADRLIQDGAARIVIVDNLFTGKEENIAKAIDKGAIFIVQDAEDYESLKKIIEDNQIDIVFNLATKALKHSFVDPRDAFDTNVKVIGNLLELLRLNAFSSLCHFSSSEVYGTAVYEPMDEKHPLNPTTTYAGGKAAADIMLKTYVSMFDVDAFIVRPFNNYGPRQNWIGPLSGIIPITAKRIIDGECPVLEGTGQQSRDFIYVEDTVDAVVKLFPVMCGGQDVNISAHGNITIRDLLEKICDYMGYDGEITRLPERGADVACHDASNDLVKSLIDFDPRNIDEGLPITLDWYKERLMDR